MLLFKRPGLLIGRLIIWSVWLHVQVGAAADWQLQDTQFAACVAELAASHNWRVAEHVTDISCHGRNIAAVDGVQQFVKLRNLSLYNNQLRSLNVSGLTQLETLNVAKNQLDILAVKDLPKLQNVMAFNNRLVRLELKQLPLLKIVKANSNKIVQFDYASLPALEKITLFDNLMPTIDYRGLPVLKLLDVRQNPMPDSLYEEMNKAVNITIMHDGNAPDWQ